MWLGWRAKKRQLFLWALCRPPVTPTMVLSVGMACWDDTYQGICVKKDPPLISRDPDFEGGSFLLKIFGRLRRPNPKGGPFENRALRGLTKIPNLRPPKRRGSFLIGVFFETYPPYYLNINFFTVKKTSSLSEI